jgi:hypothetical protein
MPLIHGLKVQCDGDADVVWRHRPTGGSAATEPLPLWDGAFVSPRPGDGGTWLDLHFGLNGRLSLRFSIAPDGGSVQSQAFQAVTESDLHGVFLEAVMRVVLFRRGLVSAHAAALVREGRAVLVLGTKGAGKSTLSSALIECGWQLLADDLVRIEEIDGYWCAYPGMSRLKLNPDVLVASGRDPDDHERRWTGQGDIPAHINEKRVLADRTPPDPSQPFPISAVFLLGARMPEAAAMVHAPLYAAGAALILLGNFTPPPLRGDALPPSYQRAIHGLTRQTAIHQIALPNDLSLLKRAATSVSTLAQG